MLRVLLDDHEGLLLLTAAAEDFARGDVLEGIFSAFMLTTMTVLQKWGGGVRGIATGTSFRRLVAKTLARQFMEPAHRSSSLNTSGHGQCGARNQSGHGETARHDSALHRRHRRVRSCLPQFDDVQVVGRPGSPEIAPLRAEGIFPTVTVRMGKTVKARDIGFGSMKVENKVRHLRGELLFAYLDDVYVVSKPDRTRALYDLLADRLHNMAGIQLHEGKTRTWNAAGECLPRMALLGPDVWSPRGVKILGTPVGTDDFVQTKIEARLKDERSLWEAVSWVPDLQCAWQILLQCASPRCHHLLRTVPPSQAARYAHGHDQGMMATMEALLEGLPGDVEQKTWAQRIATLPVRVGGFGVCDPHVPCRLLGLVGRCAPLDISTTSRGGERHSHTIGRGACRMLGRAPECSE